MQKKYVPVRFLQGKKVYLRPINLQDADLYYQMLFEPESRKLTGTQKSFTPEQISRYIDAKSQDISTILLLIALSDTDEVVGDIALQDIDSINRNANIRIMIPEERYQGNGYGSEAITLLLEHGFGVLNLHRIELNVFFYNERAAHVYEKLGFKTEGVQRDALFYNHQYHNSIIMSILEHEYRLMHLKQQ